MRKTIKERILSFALAFFMVVSTMIGGNVLEVKAEKNNTYAPYYDSNQNKVYGAPSIGTRVSPTDVFSAAELEDDERLVWMVYFTEEGARNGSEYPGINYVIFDNQTSEASGLGTFDEKYDWIVTNVYFEEDVIGQFNNKIVIEGYSVESPTIISPSVSFDWEKLSAFKIGKSVPEMEDTLVSVTGESIENIYAQGLQIKATEEHVSAGYITEDMYLNAEGGWISAEDYSSSYKVSKSDVYGYAFEMQTDDIMHSYCVLALIDNKDIKENIEVITDGVAVDIAYAYSCYSLCDFAMIYLNLGTGEDIQQVINSIVQKPTIPPNIDDIIFTEDTEDEILEQYELIVNSECTNVWVSTEDDPYAFPARIVSDENTSLKYELVNSDEAELYIRFDYIYTLEDGTKLTWLKDYTDDEHPKSLYDVSYPIVLRDDNGQIYVKMYDYGRPEGSYNDKIGVVPKEIYDKYMDWFITKLLEEFSGQWMQDAIGWWYQNPDGSYPYNSWKEIEGVWYYFNASGYMVTGWNKVGGTWYYFAGSGAMTTGWLNDGGTWYYFAGSGAMTTGWLNDGGTWYYFAGSGAMTTGWLNDGGTWYYFVGSGAMATGWLNDGGTWYYFVGSGAMVANCWVGNYYLQADGSMATNKWIGNYYVGADGLWRP